MNGSEARSAQWARVRGRLRAEFGDGVFRSWIKPMILVGCDGGIVRIGVPTRFLRDRVNALYGDRLRSLWGEEDGAVEDIELLVLNLSAAAQRPADGLSDGTSRGAGAEPAMNGNGGNGHGAMDGHATALNALSGENAGGAGGGVTQVRVLQDESDWINTLSAPLDDRFTFDNFVSGKPNEFAHAACRRVAEAERVPFNPLFLYGGVGLGKTHLMHAIAWHIRERDPGRRVVYLSAEKFMYQFIRAVRFRDTMAFKEQFRSVHVLMVDDVQFICGRESTQEEFFHTFNALIDQNRQIIISADKSPADLQGLEERMRSRLGWGLVADIHPTTYELRYSILEAKADRMTVKVPVQVIEFLAAKITSNVRELEGALLRLGAHADLVGRPVTVETAQEVLRDVLRANDRKVTIEEIQKRVAEHYNIRLADMHSPRRARAVARPRQVAMYLAKQLTSRSLPEIGRKFGGRDHTTVMHAVRKIEELRADDSGLSEDIDLLRRMLEN